MFFMEHTRFDARSLEAFMASGPHATSDILQVFRPRGPHIYQGLLESLSTFGYDVMIKPISKSAIGLGCFAYLALC